MIKDQQPLFLLIQQKAGHYGFPKGHVEKNETEVETAIREIKEETGLEVKIYNNFITFNLSCQPLFSKKFSPAKSGLKIILR